MIHIVLPPRERSVSCPFVQRTKALVRMLDMLDEAHREHPFEQEAFAFDGYGVEACRGDLVFFTWPKEKPLVPVALSIECGVGYDKKPWGPLRVYETEAWRHFCFGKYNEPFDRRRESWVIPWAFDVDVWPLGRGDGGYVSYLGKLHRDKGLDALRAVARAVPDVRFKVASTDHPCGFGSDVPANVELVGSVIGEDRAEFLGNAFAHLCPTEYVEPLNGSAIEAMLCGTPAITSNYGGFTETVRDGVTGFRCSSTGAMVGAIDACRNAVLDRESVRNLTCARFSLQTIATKWRHVLTEMRAIAHERLRG